MVSQPALLGCLREEEDQGHRSHIYTTRASSLMQLRQGAGPSLLSVVVGEGQRQLSIVLR